MTSGFGLNIQLFGELSPAGADAAALLGIALFFLLAFTIIIKK